MSKLKFDVKDIKHLSDLMKEVDLEELEITQDGDSLRLRRPGSAPAVLQSAPQETKVASTTDVVAASVKPVLNAIKAPLVGTFYHSPAPDKPPFVKVGDKVKKGTTIGIIEAMKTMNPVAATEDGEIAEVLVDNAIAVEFGQPLIRLK